MLLSPYPTAANGETGQVLNGGGEQCGRGGRWGAKLWVWSQHGPTGAIILQAGLSPKSLPSAVSKEGGLSCRPTWLHSLGLLLFTINWCLFPPTPPPREGAAGCLSPAGMGCLLGPLSSYHRFSVNGRQMRSRPLANNKHPLA